MSYLLIVINTSCHNEEIAPGPDQEEQLILDYLQEMGYNLDSVEFKDEFVLYEKDAGWNKDDLLIGIKN